ncbi:FAD-binding oxidoreductase [Verrucomicrobia bacterium S94]|nr:FAD-binding oxidoreductase [Verrucomicrobia bacterium S94]
MSVRSAIDAWEKQLGAAAVIHDARALEKYTRSVCASERQVVAVLKPVNHEQVEQIVETANTYRVPLYPISQGKQWGMGSKLPVRDGAAIVDLSGMNRILEISERFHYAVVEPGVTQRQLLDHIEQHRLKLILNVTGSSSDTSLIGNALDRGVGYFDSRADGISNMKIVLGNGQTLQTGFGHYPDSKTQNLYPHGVGPSLDGLFPQGNFGIVTSACIDLMPKSECMITAAISIKNESDLPQLVDGLVNLRRSGHIRTVAHLGNQERTHISLAPHVYQALLREGHLPGTDLINYVNEMLKSSSFGTWSVGVGLVGSKQQVKNSKKEIRRVLGSIATVRFIGDKTLKVAEKVATWFKWIPGMHEKLLLLKAVMPISGLAQGKASDASLKTLYWPVGDLENLDSLDPDLSHSGTLFCLPVVPAASKDVLQVVTETEKIFSEYGFDVAITLNLLSAKCMEGVVSLAFDRRDQEQVRRAHKCIQDMEARYVDMGYPPYRVGINSMHHVVRKGDVFWNTVQNLKDILDPNRIISPGRYNFD